MKKIVVFDINHTLIEDNSWQQLNVAFGITVEEDQIMWRLNQEGVLPNDLWVQLLNNIFRSRGKATKAVAEKAVLNYTFIQGAREVVQDLQRDGHKVILMSGAMDLLVADVAEKLGVDEYYYGGHFNFADDGSFIEMHYPEEDYLLKITQIKEIASIHSIPTQEIICVGDGANEHKIFKLTKGITFKGSKIEHDAWRVVASLNEIPRILFEN